MNASDERDTNQHAAQEANCQQRDCRKDLSSLQTHKGAYAEDSGHFCPNRRQSVPSFRNEDKYDEDWEKKKETGDCRLSEPSQECRHRRPILHLSDEADAPRTSKFF